LLVPLPPQIAVISTEGGALAAVVERPPYFVFASAVARSLSPVLKKLVILSAAKEPRISLLPLLLLVLLHSPLPLVIPNAVLNLSRHPQRLPHLLITNLRKIRIKLINRNQSPRHINTKDLIHLWPQHLQRVARSH